MRRSIVGKVTSSKMEKTRRVEVNRMFKHPKYGKTVTRRMVCHVHDEQEVSQDGDMVKIEESRPLSKTKRWVLLEVVKKAPLK